MTMFLPDMNTQAQTASDEGAGGLFLPQRQYARHGAADRRSDGRRSFRDRSGRGLPRRIRSRRGSGQERDRRRRPPCAERQAARRRGVRRDFRRFALLVVHGRAAGGDVPRGLRLGGQDRRAVYDPRRQPHGPQRRGYSETLCGRYPARRASPTRRGRERLAGRRAEVGSGIESDKIN